MNTQRTLVLQTLEQMGIPYEMTEHEAVYTMEQMEAQHLCEQGEVCKNLFLRDQKGKRHFLVTLQRDKHADLAALREKLGSSKLSFASEERLHKYLGLEKGAVSPFGLLNDQEHAVEMVFDRDLAGNGRLGVHPNDNTATVWISYDHLKQVLERVGAHISEIAL